VIRFAPSEHVTRLTAEFLELNQAACFGRERLSFSGLSLSFHSAFALELPVVEHDEAEARPASRLETVSGKIGRLPFAAQTRSSGGEA
jgi:hypothetical protein